MSQQSFSVSASLKRQGCSVGGGEIIKKNKKGLLTNPALPNYLSMCLLYGIRLERGGDKKKGG